MHPYSTVEFGDSLRHMGEPLYVPEWGTTVLLRAFGKHHRDALGPYPITVFSSHVDLRGGLERLAKLELVSVVLVVENSLRPDRSKLEQAFDIVRPFKHHYIYDRQLAGSYTKHHRYEVKRAAAMITVERFDLRDRVAEWCELYDKLIQRHALAGSMHAFPRSHHEMLARIPGVVAIGGFVDKHLVSAHIWMCYHEHAMSHLAASNDVGYALHAAYAVNAGSIALLSDRRILNFAGGSGSADDDVGLIRFKRGFANTSAPSYLCGKILDKPVYCDLLAGVRANDYFPAYRKMDQH